MAIDITTETVIVPSKATHLCPERRRGVKPNPATIWRWMLRGVKVKGQPESEAIKLESLVVGATRCTSVEALQRFFDALTAAADAEHSSAVTPPPVSKSRQKQIEAAERRLGVRAGQAPGDGPTPLNSFGRRPSRASGRTEISR